MKLLSRSAPALIALSAILASCGGAEEPSNEDIGEMVAERMAASAASEDCTPQTYMAKIARMQQLGREIGEDDPRWEGAVAASEKLKAELDAIEKAETPAEELAGLQEACKAYDRFLAAVE